jgi:hypothetical protein
MKLPLSPGWAWMVLKPLFIGGVLLFGGYYSLGQSGANSFPTTGNASVGTTASPNTFTVNGTLTTNGTITQNGGIAYSYPNCRPTHSNV